MPIVRFLEHGQITVPKKFRDALGVKKGDLAEAQIEGDKIIITPVRPTKKQAWKEIRELLNKVHNRNKEFSEEEVTRDVLKAIEELRQEEYAKAKKT